MSYQVLKTLPARPLVLILLAISITWLLHAPACAGTGGEPADDTLSVVFVSDTQSPLFPEKLVLGSNRNLEARALIFERIVGEGPEAVFHLGDIVALGFWKNSWEDADRFVEDLRRHDIPFFPIRGNHELILFPRKGEQEFAARFPDACLTGYARRIGPLAVVLLNSNFSHLDDAEIGRQQEWYERTLRELDADSSVRYVIVGCHHPPFTNNRVVGPSEEVQVRFVPPFARSEKARLFLSGHSHAAESFRIGGKDFLVLGGGCGLQHPLRTGEDRRWDDRFPVKAERRMFHYVRCSITHGALRLSVQMLEDDFSAFREAYTILLPLTEPERPDNAEALPALQP